MEDYTNKYKGEQVEIALFGGEYQDGGGATMTRDLPPFLRELLAAPPRAGEGVHDWIFRVARQLHAHLPAVEIVALR